MVVTGSIVLNPNGTVNSYILDEKDKLPPAVVEVIGKTVPAWKFQPISTLDAGNKPELAKATMNLRLVASPLPDGSYGISVKGASFGKEESQSKEDISWKSRNVPLGVAIESMREGMSGTVYLLLKIDHQGRVADIGIEQVNLRAVASDAQMEAWRRGLSRLAMKAANNWSFNVPESGKEAAAEHLMVRVPINFDPNGRTGGYGQWDAYVPGPVNKIPWSESNTQETSHSADAIPNNGIAFQDDHRFVLLNPPDKG